MQILLAKCTLAIATAIRENIFFCYFLLFSNCMVAFIFDCQLFCQLELGIIYMYMYSTMVTRSFKASLSMHNCSKNRSITVIV